MERSIHGETQFLHDCGLSNDIFVVSPSGLRITVPFVDLKAFVEAQAWVRVEDGMPECLQGTSPWESSERVLVADGQHSDIASYRGKSLFFDEPHWLSDDGLITQVTHWRYLPAPPGAKP